MSDSITEFPSNYDNLEHMEIRDLLYNINKEDKSVPLAVESSIPQIQKLVEQIVARMSDGGRLFYVGAGTSGRLGIVDASECPPTFGTSPDLVIGLIAGGDQAIRQAVEFAEDDYNKGWEDLLTYNISNDDVLIGIAASGKTPYVIGAVDNARKHGILTGCITCNKQTALAAAAECPVEVVVGPEFVTGSTRMKAGTAQKLVLNMISTSVMIKLGHVKGNRMVDMQMSNTKLLRRAIKMIMEELNVEEAKAEKLLKKFGSVRKAIEHNHP